MVKCERTVIQRGLYDTSRGRKLIEIHLKLKPMYTYTSKFNPRLRLHFLILQSINSDVSVAVHLLNFLLFVTAHNQLQANAKSPISVYSEARTLHIPVKTH